MSNDIEVLIKRFQFCIRKKKKKDDIFACLR
jgi:hypothetical protein